MTAFYPMATLGPSHVAPIVLPNHPSSPAPSTRYKDIVIYSVQFYLYMLSTQMPRGILLITSEMKLCRCGYVKNEGGRRSSGLA